jgi:serine/threonine-protein kinase
VKKSFGKPPDAPERRAPFAPPLLLVQEEAREKVGQVLGSYELLELLGEGSMGRVYKARHVRLGKLVALKVLRLEHSRNPDLLRRFFQEAQTVNQINHENIVEVFDFVDESTKDGTLGRVYCVMELLSGQPLAELIEAKSMTLDRMMRIIRQVCAALDAAHRVGVVHRDVKPDNIFIIRGPEGEDFVKVLDFGVAKLLTPLDGVETTRTLDGLVIGTPDYMAPEQASGTSEMDVRADIYSLGVVFYQMIAGHLPYDAVSLAELMVQIGKTPPRSFPDTTPAGEYIPPELKVLVLRCLEKSADKRPQSMALLAAALEPILHSSPVRPTRRRWRLLAGAAAGLTLFAAASTVGMGTKQVKAVASAPTPFIEAQLVLPEPPAATTQPEMTELELPALPVQAVAAPRRKVKPSAAKPALHKETRRRMSHDAVLDPFAD